MTTTIAQALEARLRRLGVSRVYGEPLAGLTHVPVDDPDLAVLLADADGRLGHHDGSGRLGAALLAGPILHLSSSPGGTSPLHAVTSAEELANALVDPPGTAVPGTLALHLDLDLDAPAPDGLVATEEPERVAVMTLDPSLASLDIVVVVGPGVVRASSVDELRSFARTSGFGILNSWGAKGVERWDSPFHFGTAGLQARDMALGGVGDADVVIVSGLDPDETPLESLGNWVVQEVPPTQLGALATGWTASRELPERPPLYDALAKVITPLYEDDGVPLSGARAALHLSGALPDRGIAVADPGAAGFWIARTFPTSIPNSVCVPATYTPGFAAAAAVVCALEARPCLAVTDQVGGIDGIDDVSAAVLELAESKGLAVSLQLWGADGRLDSSTAHVELLAEALAGHGVRIDEVPVDLDAIGPLEAVAGELVAWPDGDESIS
jgi:Thiamine pyrophosphate enzyme, central domain